MAASYPSSNPVSCAYLSASQEYMLLITDATSLPHFGQYTLDVSGVAWPHLLQ